MGFNTAVVILNDELLEIEKDPEFGKKLADAIREQVGKRFGIITRIGHYSSHVVSTAYADVPQIVRVLKNIGELMKHQRGKLSPYNSGL